MGTLVFLSKLNAWAFATDEHDYNNKKPILYAL